MGIFKFLNFFNIKKRGTKPNTDSVTIWEDDYLQVEVLPSDNLAFLQEQLQITYDFGEVHRTKEGFFTDIMVRKKNPFTTRSKEFRADTLESTLSGHGMPKYSQVEHGNGYFFEPKGHKTVAYGFDSCTVFFEKKEDFVDCIWLKIKQIPPSNQLEIIASTLYDIGESYDLILVDWDSLELIDLKNKRQVRAYIS